MRYQPTRPSEYPTLAHFWRDWNGEYVNSTLPRLVVRFEDILFDSQRTIKTVCECVGGTMRPHFAQEEDASKDKTLGHHGPVNNRDKALRLYSDNLKRFEHYTYDDLSLVKRVAGASPLFRAMDYDFDINDALDIGAGRPTRRRLLFGPNATRA